MPTASSSVALVPLRQIFPLPMPRSLSVSHRRAGRRATGAAILVGALLAPPWAETQAAPDAGRGPAVAGAVARPAAVGQAGQHDAGSLRDQYDEVLGEEAALIAKVQEAQAERARLTGELEKLEADLQARNVELLQAQAELDDTEFLGMIYAQAVVDARKKVEIASERLRRQIVSTYVNGGADASVLEALLKARSGEEMGQALTYSKAIVGDTEVLGRNLQKARAAA